MANYDEHGRARAAEVILDASALVAIVFEEPEAQNFANFAVSP